MTEGILSEITVTIVSYNSGAMIEACLGALSETHALIIVDNASTDGSPDRLSRAFPNAKLVRNAQNVGYGTAMNQAMALVETPYALHLNPDAVLTLGALETLLDTLKAGGEKAVLAAPLLIDPNRGLNLNTMGPGEVEGGPISPEPEGPFCTWSITGAVWLVHVSNWRALAGFDENIFLYNEDFEFCRRATRAGYSLLVEPRATGEHLTSQSTPPSLRIRWRKEWNIIWGLLYVTRKFEGPGQATRDAWRLFGKCGLKAIFYMLVLDKKRFFRDLAIAHAAATFLLQSTFGRNLRARRA